MDVDFDVHETGNIFFEGEFSAILKIYIYMIYRLDEVDAVMAHLIC